MQATSTHASAMVLNSLPMPRFVSLVLVALTLVVLGACSTPPPPHWDDGGAVLALAPARWERAKQRSIELLEDGTVLEGKKTIFVIDRAGRVVDSHRDPLAILLPDGYLAGNDDTALGRVGVTNAAPPGSTQAWLAVMPNGDVAFFDSDGDRKYDGGWSGCEGPVHRTCTLITHLVALRTYRSDRGPRVGIGIGFVF